jgi:excisionase family DNA binding protein
MHPPSKDPKPPSPGRDPLPSLGDFLTVRAVADRLSVSTRAVYDWIRAGQIPVVRMGRTLRIPSAALKDWVALHLQPSANEAPRATPPAGPPPPRTPASAPAPANLAGLPPALPPSPWPGPPRRG